MAILPLYLGLLFPATQYVIAIRVLRVMRIFRVLKLVRFANEANVLTISFRHARRKMLIIVGVLALITTLLGALMYVVEGAEHGFSSIPRSIYWAIVTMTTVGYGDIAPGTALGQFIAALSVLLGYAMLAVTGGIITAELTNEIRQARQQRQCPHCERSGHEIDAGYCKFCGGELEPATDKQIDPTTTRDKLD
ncbi:MAG: ion transporter [Rhodanobacter sp.]